MSNYSTIIESLVSTRVNEGTLLRDYKGIISQLKKALLSKSTDVIPYDVNRLYLSLDCGWYGLLSYYLCIALIHYMKEKITKVTFLFMLI